MKRALIFIIILYLMHSSILNTNAQDTISSDSAYIHYSSLNIASDDDFSSFALLDSALAQNKVFIVGENHQFKKSNIDLRLKMLKYLNKNAGVTTMFLEQGYSWGWMLNKYIQTGDTVVLSILKKYSWSIYEKLFSELKEYNDSLEDDCKIKVIGIDVERFYGLSVRTLSYLFPDVDAPDEISLHVESIKGLAAYNDNYVEENVDENNYSFSSYSDYSSENVVDEFIENYKENREIFMNYLGENYPVFDKTVISLEGKKRYSDFDDQYMTHAYVYREQYMLKEFMSYLKAHPDEKFYGQLGRCHVNLLNQKEACSWYEFNSIATRMNNIEDSLIKGKVCTIGVFYPKGYLGSNIIKDVSNLSSIIGLANPEGLTLFKVDSNDLFKDLLNKYQYIIINNTELDEWEESIDEYGVNFDDDIETSPGFTLHLDVAYGYRYLNFKSLNKVFRKNGLQEMDVPVNYFSFALSSLIDHSFYYSMEAYFIPPIKKNYQDSMTTGFTGYGYTTYFGADLIKGRVFDIVPRFGVGLAELKLMVEKDEDLDQNTFFGDNVVSIYKNPGYYLDLSVDSRINIAMFSLGFKGGYVFDISKTQWRAGKLLDESPRTPLSGFYASGNISVSFGK